MPCSFHGLPAANPWPAPHRASAAAADEAAPAELHTPPHSPSYQHWEHERSEGDKLGCITQLCLPTHPLSAGCPVGSMEEVSTAAGYGEQQQQQQSPEEQPQVPLE